MDVHGGHRERLKQSFIEHGLDAMNDITALELLLFYAVPRRDTNELAHRLLDRFENLSNVFQASIQELTEVQRQILTLYYFENKRPAEIARIRGVHRSTVLRTLRRAENRLRRFLQY